MRNTYKIEAAKGRLLLKLVARLFSVVYSYTSAGASYALPHEEYRVKQGP